MILPFIFNGELMELIRQLMLLYETLNFSFMTNLGLGLLIGFAISFFLCSFGQTAISSITREGKRIWLMQSLPITYKDQVKGRLLASYFFQFINMAPITIVLLLIFRPSIEIILGYIIGVAVAAFVISNVGLFVDILKPKLNWDTPQEAIKQNFNIFIFSMGIIVYAIVIIFIIIKLFEYGVISFSTLFYVAIFLGVFHLIIGIVFSLLNVKMFEKRLRKFNI